MMMRPLAVSSLLVCASSGCDWSLQRMMDQNRCDTDEATVLFANGTCDQLPPEHTFIHVPAPLDEVRSPVDRAALARGRENFETFCAVCHGLLGDGESQVAEQMALRRPPSLLEARVRSMSDEYLERVIEHGYGLMPSYGHVLAAEARRGVVAHLRVLSLSQDTSLAELPPAAREEARRWLH